MVKRTIKRRKSIKAAPLARGGTVINRAFDLVMWIDSPFKLFAVVVLGLLFGSGFLAYHYKDQIIASRAGSTMVERDDLARHARDLIRDTGAITVVIHKIDVPKNSRETVIAMRQDGNREVSLEGSIGVIFNVSQNRQKAAAAMLNAEIDCDTFEASSKIGQWVESQGVRFLCRAPIGKRGDLVGYLAIGFSQQPKDIIALRGRISLAVDQMVH
jgi:hypothetical protein